MEKIESYLMENLNEFVGFARKRLGNVELAADAVQESMLKALAGAEQIRNEEKAKAWFYRILRRTIIDLYRRRDARDRMLAGLEQELNSPPDSDEERVVCRCMVRLLPTLTPQLCRLDPAHRFERGNAGRCRRGPGHQQERPKRPDSSRATATQATTRRKLPNLRQARLLGLSV
jgi:RNA polymerase sigma factor (sigma-70 family)